MGSCANGVGGNIPASGALWRLMQLAKGRDRGALSSAMLVAELLIACLAGQAFCTPLDYSLAPPWLTVNRRRTLVVGTCWLGAGVVQKAMMAKFYATYRLHDYPSGCDAGANPLRRLKPHAEFAMQSCRR